MADLRAAIKQLTGNEPSPEQISRIQAMAHALDIPQNDAMFPILVTLDIYYGVFSKLPASMKASADEVAENAEAAAKGRIAAASAELVAQAGDRLVAAFRNDLGKTLWSRSIWAGLVLLVVGLGSYGAGEVDIWWHSRQLHQIEAKEKIAREKLAMIEDQPGYGAIYSCSGMPCVPLANIPNNNDWTISSGPYKGTPLGILNMQVIKGIQEKQ